MVTKDKIAEYVNKREVLYWIDRERLSISADEPLGMAEYDLNGDSVVIVDTYSGPRYDDDLYVSRDECHIALCKEKAAELASHIHGFESESESLNIAKFFADYFSSIYKGMAMARENKI